MMFASMVELKTCLEEKKQSMLDPLTNDEEQMLVLLNKLLLKEIRMQSGTLPSN